MRFSVLTLFPGIFSSFLGESLIQKAMAKGLFSVELTDIRDHTTDRHRTADDRPYGGGPGMVMLAEPLAAALEAVTSRHSLADGAARRVVLFTPAGRPFTQARAAEYAELDHLVLVCGRYEGVDQRFADELVDEELSLGDFVLSGGEVPAMAVIEAVTRLLPGVLGSYDSVAEESFSQALVEYPHYTRPRVFRGRSAPEVLLSGDHAAVARWRRAQAIRRTLRQRPDLLTPGQLSPEDRACLEEFGPVETPGRARE